MLLWYIAAFCAFFIKGLCGFANTLVFTSILSFGAANLEITPVELLLGYPSNLLLAWRGRKLLQPRRMAPVAALVLAGNAVGALLLKNLNARPVRAVCGVAIMLTGVQMLLRERSGSKREDPPAVGAAMGLAAGVLSGLFGIGAMLAAYVSRRTDSNEAFKANLSALFAVENTFRVVLYLVLGIITLSSAKSALLLLPAALLGLFCGLQGAKKLNETHARYAVLALLIVSGAVLTAKAIF